MTNTQTFTIYRDNELDPDFIRAQRIRKAQAFNKVLSAHLSYLGTVLSEKAYELYIPVHLDIVDAQNGSHLRKEYFERKRQQRIQQVRESIFTD